MFSRSFLLCASASLYFLSALSSRFSRMAICLAIAWLFSRLALIPPIFWRCSQIFLCISCICLSSSSIRRFSSSILRVYMSPVSCSLAICACADTLSYSFACFRCSESSSFSCWLSPFSFSIVPRCFARIDCDSPLYAFAFPSTIRYFFCTPSSSACWSPIDPWPARHPVGARVSAPADLQCLRVLCCSGADVKRPPRANLDLMTWPPRK